MKESWKIYKLGELVDSKRGITYGVVQPGEFLEDGGVPILKVNNLTERKYSIKDAFRISTEVESKYERSRLVGNEILVSLVGSLGYIYKVRKELIGWNVVRAIGVLPIKEEFDKDWIYWFMRSPDIQREFQSQATTTVQATLNLKELRDIEIKYPDADTRCFINSTLNSIDDKIELNLQMNQTLEAMAQAIFKEWFVNFNFPGFDGELVDGLPKGWKAGKLNDLIKILSGFAFKSTDFVDEGEYKLVTIKNVQDGQFDSQTTDKLKAIPAKMPEYCSLSEGNILLSLTGNVGRICIVTGEKFLLNQRVAKLEPVIERDRAFTYFLMRSQVMKEKLISISRGTAQQNLSPIETGKIELVIPESSIMGNYSEIVTPLFEKTIDNINENISLTQIRDSLLPKLMTGKIEIKN